MGEHYGKTGIKIIPTWREKKITRHPCYNIQPWLTSWNICCCRECLFDRQLMIVFDIGNGHISQQVLMVHAQEMDIHIYPLVILVKYSARGYYSWSQILSLLFLKANVLAQLLISNIVVELLKPYIVLKFMKSEIVVELFPKSAIVVKFLKLNTWFDMKPSLSKQSRTASSSIFHFIFRVVLMQHQLTLPKTV